MMVRTALRRGFLLAAAVSLVVQAALLQQVWGAATASAKPDKGVSKIDLNTATTEQLQQLPGIGAAYAKKLVAGRPYASLDDLSKSGIPAATLAKIKPLLVVSEPAPAAKPQKGASKIDLNTATTEQLQQLPGIGAAYAKKLVARRPYASVDDLSKTGIPAATLSKIKPLVVVSAAPPAKAQKPVPKTTKAAAKVDQPAAKSEQPAAKAANAAAATPPTKGMVWVNTESKVFHKEGSRWYGKTKQGKWMTQEDAIKEGYRAAKE